MRADLKWYFLLAYALTWAFTIPFVIAWHTVLDQTLSAWALVFLPAPFGPTFAALILVARRDGWTGVRALLRKLLIWRVPAVWYVFALCAPILVVALAVGLSEFRGALADFEPWPGLAIAPLAMIAALPFGPLAEELGWRGFAQPRLLRSGGLWKSSLIIGVAWTFWHTPMFWFPGAAIPSFLEPGLLSVALYLAQMIAEACLMTFLFVMSRGSVLLAVLYHTSFNTAETIVFRTLPEPTASQELQVYVIGIGLSWFLAAALLSWLGRRQQKYWPGAGSAV